MVVCVVCGVCDGPGPLLSLHGVKGLDVFDALMCAQLAWMLRCAAHGWLACGCGCGAPPAVAGPQGLFVHTGMFRVYWPLCERVDEAGLATEILN